MKKFRHIILALTALILASCAVDEFWEGMDHAEGEEVVMTFKPRFEDFESVTKTIGDGTKVDKLLVQVYDELGKTPVFSKEYEKDDWKKVQIAFYYGKTYKVYFWAYNSTGNAYEIVDGCLKNGVKVTYPDKEQNLAYDTLEHLDAFYAVETINLSDNIHDNTTPSLTRPFAQVNLLANKSELLNAKASTVIFELSAASAFVPGGTSTGVNPRTFTFTSNDYFQSIEDSLDGKVYLGTTYIFVSSQEISGKVTLKDENGKTLRGPSPITIPLAENSRTNLVFSGIEPAKLPWDDNKFVVPGDDDNDGWIHITCPEELAALLIKPTADNINVHICKDIDMGDVDTEILNQITGKSFLGLTLDGGIYPDNNMDSEHTGNNTIKNLSAAAFIGTATKLEVRNLTLENVKISAATHVGVLVNELKGNGTFTNVTVKGSSATTNSGAAGGFVGRSVRIDEKDRKETLALTFTGCRIEGTDVKNIVATGSLAEGKFVGLFSGYDNGETLTFDDKCSAGNNTRVKDYASRYTEGNEGEWLETNDYTPFNGFLGEETYNRGTIMFGVNQFVPMWDGIKTVKPIYEDSAEKIAQIWSAFDLAYLQGKSLTTLRFKADVDMCGVCDNCKNGKGNSTIANDNLSTCQDCKPFDAILSLNNLYGENHTLYNLFVQGVHEASDNNNQGRAFIRSTYAGTFENFTFDGAVIKCIDDIQYRSNTKIGGNGYAGTLTSKVAGKMKITNVHAKNGHVIGISKLGGMIGFASAGIEADKCSVEYYTVENHRINVLNSYSVSIEKEILGTKAKAECSEDFFTEGEAGGFIGFINSNSTIKNCNTNNITMKCHGQDDRSTEIDCYTWGKKYVFFGDYQWNRILGLPYTIAGRHCNAFIGDIRTPDSNIITITDCSTYDNNYVEGYDADYYGKNGYSSKDNNELVGCVYFVGKDLSFSSLSMHAGDYKGTVTINGESMPFIGG